MDYEEIEETISHMVSILDEIYPDGIPDEEMDKLRVENEMKNQNLEKSS